MSFPVIGVHVGSPDPEHDPLADAKAAGADAVQIFLADPQGWKAPKPHPRAEQLLGADVDVYVHAPYVLNVATSNNRIRIPSRKLLGAHAVAAAAIGASGLIVHGGHVLAGDDEQTGFDNWRKTFARQADQGGFPLPILIENTAGGDRAMARHLSAIGRLWEAVGEFGAGFTLDTCHAHAGGLDLSSVVEDVRAITGRIDLVHCNNSQDEAGSGRDRHAPLTGGRIPVEALVGVLRAARAPAVLETPGDASGHAEEVELLRSALA